jgi:hypothetical protein
MEISLHLLKSDGYLACIAQNESFTKRISSLKKKIYVFPDICVFNRSAMLPLSHLWGIKNENSTGKKSVRV